MSNLQTVAFILERDGQPPDLRPWAVFLKGFIVASFGIGAATLLFPAEASMVGVFLVTLGQARTVHTLLDRNRNAVWRQHKAVWATNAQLGVALTMLFLGVFLAYAIVTLALPEARVVEIFARQVRNLGVHDLTDVRFDGLGTVLRHNLVVALVGFLFAFLYRHGGMVLVLAWNASAWGVVFAWMARNTPSGGFFGAALTFLKSLVATLPHLLLESVAYMLVAIAGVFLAKSIGVFDWKSIELRRALRSVALVGSVGVGVLFLAAAVEALVAPALIRLLF